MNRNRAGKHLQPGATQEDPAAAPFAGWFRPPIPQFGHG